MNIKPKPFSSVIACAVFVLLLLVPRYGAAATYYVSPTGNDNNAGTLSAPLKTISVAVNNTVSGDTIVLEDGTFSGPGNVNINPGGRTLTFTSLHGPTKSIIDCAGIAYAFHMSNGEGRNGSPAIIENLTITNGAVDPSGGVISNRSCILSIVNCVITNLVPKPITFGFGPSGAVSNNYPGALTKISGCTFSGNSDPYGATIQNSGEMVISKCTFSNNSSYRSTVESYGKLAVTGSVFVNNQGVGIYQDRSANSTSTLTVDSSRFFNCPKGAIIAYCDNLNVTRSVFSGNSADYGAAIFGYSTTRVSGCLFSGNKAALSGGAVILGGQATLDNSVFVGNTVSGGSGGAIGSTSSFNDVSSNVNILFCTFVNNSASVASGAVVATPTTTVVNSILFGDIAPANSEINNLAKVTYSDVQYGYGGAGNIKINPLFMNAAAGDFHLTAASPCVHSGVTVNGVTADITGFTHPSPPSMGAYDVPFPAPAITSFTPASGAVGTSVTITGSNLAGASSVTFNGSPSTSVTVISPLSVKATVPAGATTGKINVKTGGGAAVSVSNFVVPATISSFAPASGPIGTKITITGTSLTGTSGVKINGIAATSVTVPSATSVTAIVAAGTTSGPIAVTTAGLTATTLGVFTVLPPAPTIASFTPTSGTPGTVVTIAGTNFTSASSVKFNGVAAAAVTVVSAASLKATVPAGAATGRIGVTTAGGSALSATPFTVILLPPTISSFAPTSGPVGTKITITGTNLTFISGVAIHGLAATSITRISPTSITAVVAAGATTGPIIVATPGGVTTSTAPFTVTASAPIMTSFTPVSGPAGTVVTITGLNLAGVSVTFNGKAPAAVTVVSATSVKATVPVGATSGQIGVTTSGGSAASGVSFTVLASPPTITSFAPLSGPVGSKITITGTNLLGLSSVRVNGVAAASVTVVSANSATAIVAAGTSTGTVSITTPGGIATSGALFTVTPPPPTISSFLPALGDVGTRITISGANLTGASSVTIGGVAATSVRVVSSTSVTAIVAPGSLTGSVSITTPDGTATSTSEYTVTSPSKITSFSPQSGPIGTLITIYGVSLAGATAVYVNGVPATNLVAGNPAFLTARVGPGSTSGKVSVVTQLGTGVSTASFTVTAQ